MLKYKRQKLAKTLRFEGSYTEKVMVMRRFVSFLVICGLAAVIPAACNSKTETPTTLTSAPSLTSSLTPEPPTTTATAYFMLSYTGTSSHDLGKYCLS